MSFARAADLIEAGNTSGARRHFHGILAQPDLEVRHYLQAWDGLRATGEQPSADVATHLYGVVLDFPVDGGSDTLAAYADYSCRYLNHSGKAIIWDHPNDSLDPLVDGLLAAGRTLIARIGPWKSARPPVPAGMARISLLCPAGLHFGQGEFGAFLNDPLAAPVFNAGAALFKALLSTAMP